MLQKPAPWGIQKGFRSLAVCLAVSAVFSALHQTIFYQGGFFRAFCAVCFSLILFKFLKRLLGSFALKVQGNALVYLESALLGARDIVSIPLAEIRSIHFATPPGNSKSSGFARWILGEDGWVVFSIYLKDGRTFQTQEVVRHVDSIQSQLMDLAMLYRVLNPGASIDIKQVPYSQNVYKYRKTPTLKELVILIVAILSCCLTS